MAHRSENCERLEQVVKRLRDLSHLQTQNDDATVVFLHFPAGRTDEIAAASECACKRIAQFCESLNPQTTVCILTTPPDAARLLPFLEHSLFYQLWVAVKLREGVYRHEEDILPESHAVLLILSRYRSSLRHTITRIAYTYCPACGKTTKDYGGKKHTYSSYGTLISDVWRDIDCNPFQSVPEITNRLRDLFGIAPYRTLNVFDLRDCEELQPKRQPGKVKEDVLPFLWKCEGVPVGSRLINDDCLSALKSVQDCSVDFCFADPPYNLQKKYDHWNDALELQEYFSWCDQWLSELARTLKPGRTLAVINIPLWAVRHYQHLCKTLKFQAWIAWEGLSLPVRMIMPSHYAILCFSKGESRQLPGLGDKGHKCFENEQLLPLREWFCLRSTCVSERRQKGVVDREAFSDLWYDVHRLKHNSRRVDHPCQLPPSLMRRLFYIFTEPKEFILDCFDGAGTSTLVAHQMSRRFIGIELSAKYHKIAMQRHEMIEKGEDPFGKRDYVPQAKNSRVERLPKQKYAVSKKLLQLEVRAISRRLGHIPSRDEVIAYSKFPIEYFDNYFISWGEVCAAARHDGMSEMPTTQSAKEVQLSIL